jgi:predicted MPP superfamily phosphohydrolase
MNLNTIILRFRDLGLEQGQTISLHQEIIREKGTAWWGWWNKDGEQVPHHAFKQLQLIIQKNPIELYLFDSGGMQIYKAVCSKIHFENTGEKTSTPDASQTPDYYKKVSFKAWFRFNQIHSDPIPNTDLHDYSYYQVPEFFENNESRFIRFYNKQVSSLNELKDQDRTIYFLRKWNSSDPIDEISFRNPRQSNPSHFPQEIRERTSDSVLLLSDLHFTSNGYHAFPAKNDSALGKASLSMAINSAIGEEAIAAIVLAGDFSWKADPSEFEMAKTFISELRSMKSLENYDVIMCPGNHDIAFSSDPSDDNKEVTVAFPTAKKAYEDFYQSQFFLKPNEFLSSGRRFLLNRTSLVDIVCINSSHLQQLQHSFQGHGFVGDDQLNHAKTSMSWANPSSRKISCQSPYRVLVLHHNIFPVTFRELPESGRSYSVVLDAEAILRWAVEQKVDLIVHGHMHQPYCTKVERLINPNSVEDHSTHCLYVLGLGSAGVSASHLGESRTNSFAVAKFHANQIEINIHTVDAVNPSKLERTYVLPFQ